MQKQLAKNVWGPRTDFGLVRDEMLEQVQLHLLRHLGDYQTAYSDADGWAGRSREDGPPVDVLVVPPQGERRFAYVTSFGCSFRPLPAKSYEDQGVRRRVEFVLAAQQKGDPGADTAMLNLCANTVRQFAKLVHMNPVSVEPGETVAFSIDPKPIFPNTQQVAFAFMEPRLPANGFSSMKLANGEEVRFIAPVPVFREELDAAKQFGTTALTHALMVGGVTEMLDMKRAPVARPVLPARKTWRKRIFGLFSRK
jgi:hypothetical protein